MMTRRFMTAMTIAFLILGSVIGCGTPAPPAIEVSELVAGTLDLSPNVSVDEVAQALQRNDVVIIDVREDYEYHTGHIPGAELLPLGQIPDRVADIPTDVPVILVCRSGNRSGQAFDYLSQQGFDNVHNMLGGMIAWTEAGYATE
ncbi:MAG: rhodanese-like domain-containing protein [Anaerolineae bacterium]|nr:rhodanese-like domain-containing protein [Anaerolineae bacterium]